MTKVAKLVDEEQDLKTNPKVRCSALCSFTSDNTSFQRRVFALALTTSDKPRKTYKNWPKSHTHKPKPKAKHKPTCPTSAVHIHVQGAA